MLNVNVVPSRTTWKGPSQDEALGMGRTSREETNSQAALIFLTRGRDAFLLAPFLCGNTHRLRTRNFSQEVSEEALRKSLSWGGFYLNGCVKRGICSQEAVLEAIRTFVCAFKGKRNLEQGIVFMSNHKSFLKLTAFFMSKMANTISESIF